MKRWLIPLCCLSIVSVAAAAQEAPPTPGPAVRQACQADIQKLCTGVQPGGGRIRACIAQHRDELSPPCREALASARAHRRAAKGNVPPADTGAPPQESRADN